MLIDEVKKALEVYEKNYTCRHFLAELSPCMARKLIAAEKLANALERKSPFTGLASGGDVVAALTAYRKAGEAYAD